MARINKAIKAVGGLTKLAERVGVEPQVIVHWRKRGVPAERVLDVERATIDEKTGEPQVSRTYLRPDLYPPEDRAAA